MAFSGSDGADRDALVFFFDFASPYAYFAFDQCIAISAEFGVPLDLRLVLVWAILRDQGIPPPLDSAARKAYFAEDMPRSAAFYGLPYAHPEDMPISTHLAARLWLGHSSERRKDLAQAVFQARFVDGRDIRDRSILADIAKGIGTASDDAMKFMDSPENRDTLIANVSQAVTAGAPGVPFFTWRGEKFFGAHRLPQLRWRLETAAQLESGMQ